MSRLDEGKGDTAGDSSGNNHHGTLHGAQWVDGASIRQRIDETLVQIGQPAVPALVEALNDAHEAVRRLARSALQQIDPEAAAKANLP